MKITEYQLDQPLLEKVNTTVLKRNIAGESAHRLQPHTMPEYSTGDESDRILAEECTLRILVDNTPAVQITCTRTNITELVLGRLLTEGYIHSVHEVNQVDVGQEGDIVKVYLQSGKANSDVGLLNAFSETVSTCSVDRRMYLSKGRTESGLTPVPQLRWDPEWIWLLADRFSEDTELHRLTHATHSCFLMKEGRIVFEAEDLGRHNAIDKAVGYALRKGIPLSQCILYTTGRMPADMVRKVIRAGVPVMVSKEAPTAEGLRLAQKYGMTLIGNLKHGKMHVYIT